LAPTGVEFLPDALKKAGLAPGLRADYAGRVEAPPYDTTRDEETGLLNPQGIREFSGRLADKVEALCKGGRFPVVLGGDCSILIGCMLGLRRIGSYGLFFVDGHADFYQPEAEPRGEVASMELAILSGRGPSILADIEDRAPLVLEREIVAFGYRDAQEQAKYRSQDIRETRIRAIPLADVRTLGIETAARIGLKPLMDGSVSGFWIHLDADVLDDAIMPAVDYRLPGGLQWGELRVLLQILIDTDKAVGISVAIFNPTLDKDGKIAEELTRTIVGGLVFENRK
jgi:arginase